jgi:hypothetical protein
MIYTFEGQLAYSHGVSSDGSFHTFLIENIPGAINVVKAELADDKNGVDWWVNRINDRPLSVDLKVRADDPITKGWGDDVALETWSKVDEQIPGWSRDPRKKTDYILWYWEPTARCCLVPFPMLCAVFLDKWQEWSNEYKRDTQTTQTRSGKWKSECVFVPRRVLWAEMYKRFAGSLRETA